MENEKQAVLFKLLNEKIVHIEDLIKNNDKEELHQWKQEVLMVLDQLIGDDSKYYQQFSKISFSSSILSMGNKQENERRNVEARIRGLEKAKSELNAIIFGIQNNLL